MSAPHTDVEQVEATNAAFYEALEQGDFEEVASLWLTPADLGVDETYHDPADTGVISCVHPGWPVLTGRGEVLRSYALIMANTDYIQFFLTDVHVSVTGDTAVVTCTENILSGGPARRPARSSAPCSANWSSPPTCSGAPRGLEALVPPRLSGARRERRERGLRGLRGPRRHRPPLLRGTGRPPARTEPGPGPDPERTDHGTDPACPITEPGRTPPFPSPPGK